MRTGRTVELQGDRRRSRSPIDGGHNWIEYIVDLQRSLVRCRGLVLHDVPMMLDGRHEVEAITKSVMT